MTSELIESLEQFHVDAPRISFYINANEYIFQTTADLHQRIIEFSKKHTHPQERLIYWCTQIPLASLYTTKHTQIKKMNEAHHLFDNGRQRVTFDDYTGTLHIVKPFRVAKEDNNGQFHTTQSLSLHVTVLPNDECVQWIEHTVLPPLTFDHLGSVGVVCALTVAYFMIR